MLNLFEHFSLKLVDVSELFVKTVTHFLFELHISICLLQLDVSLVIENLLLQLFEIQTKLLKVGRVISYLISNDCLKVIIADQVLCLLSSLVIGLFVDDLPSL